MFGKLRDQPRTEGTGTNSRQLAAIAWIENGDRDQDDATPNPCANTSEMFKSFRRSPDARFSTLNLATGTSMKSAPTVNAASKAAYAYSVLEDFIQVPSATGSAMREKGNTAGCWWEYWFASLRDHGPLPKLNLWLTRRIS